MRALARRAHASDGQALVEFGIVISIIFILSFGIIDGARAFFAYNVIANAARDGARFGAVVGGTCGSSTSTSDWCSQLGNSTSTSFWQQNGNYPLQTSSASCPHNYTSAFTHYYLVGNFTGGTSTTVLGAIAQRFDTGPGSTSSVNGAAIPGLRLSQVYVCIQLPPSAYSGTFWQPVQGDTLTVYVYYRFAALDTLVTSVNPINMVASSNYVIE